MSGSGSTWEGLRQGRCAVAGSLAMGATTGPEPEEETLTWTLLANAAWASSRITVRAFNHHEESRYTGADWLWWWEGDPDEWFGCLVQAKRVGLVAGELTFGYDYRPTPSAAVPEPPSQIRRLLDAADTLAVPAAYLLYRSPVLGYPDQWSCPQIEPGWESCAAAFIAAAVVNEWHVYGRSPDFETMRPVECFACDGRCAPDMARLAWYARGLAEPSVRDLLSKAPTTVARRAFRALFSELVQLRATQLRGNAPDMADEMHSGFRLGEHFMRGVREPPWYVAAALAGEPVTDLAGGLEEVAGVVIVSDD